MRRQFDNLSNLLGILISGLWRHGRKNLPPVMVLALTMTHVLVIISPRFRLPLEAAATLVASLSLSTILRKAFGWGIDGASG